MSEIIGFKEWQIICQALQNGTQSLILRKGGIHEGRAGFSFAHDEFVLFPTRFHAQHEMVKGAALPCQENEWKIGDIVTVTHYAKAVWAKTITDPTQLASIADFHLYADQLVQERFDWEGKGMHSGSIHVALVRVYELSSAWEFPYTAAHGGCRSWLKLNDFSDSSLKNARAVIPDERFAEIETSLHQILS